MSTRTAFTRARILNTGVNRGCSSCTFFYACSCVLDFWFPGDRGLKERVWTRLVSGKSLWMSVYRYYWLEDVRRLKERELKEG